LVRLNCAPDAGAAGVMVPVVITPFSTMLPTGVPGQYSSYAEESANAGAAVAANIANTPPLPATNPVTTAATARPVRLDLPIIPPLFGGTFCIPEFTFLPGRPRRSHCPTRGVPLVGTMTREGVRPNTSRERYGVTTPTASSRLTISASIYPM